MKKIFSAFFALLLVFSCVGSALAMEYAEGEVLVVLEVPTSTMSVAASDMTAFAGSLSSQASVFANSVGVSAVGTYAEIARVTGKSIVHLRSDSKTTEQLVKELENNPQVKSVQPNYLRKLSATPNDPRYNDLWGLKKIGADKAWDVQKGSKSVVVAVIDSGIKATHPDLAANMVIDSFGQNGRHFYDNGKIDTTYDPDTAFPGIKNGAHGTHVAGTVGAVGNNTTGVVGVNWNVGLLAVNVFSSNGTNIGAYDTDTIRGINYILSEKSKGMGIRVANMSLGGWNYPQPANSPYGLAIESMSNAGIIVAIAAGNEAQDIANHNGFFHSAAGRWVAKGELVYPASYRFAHTISVGATDANDAKAEFSNYSPNWVDIAAPGTSILSTVPTSYNSSGYDNMQGTSMATPHVAGVAALLFAAFPLETAAQIKSRILDNADKIGLTFWKHGRLNVEKAMGTVPGNIPVTGVTLDLTAFDLEIGLNKTLTATVVPANATNRKVTWSSDKPNFATVVDGKVHGVAAGMAFITVKTDDGGFTKSCLVTVKAGGGGDPDPTPVANPKDVLKGKDAPAGADVTGNRLVWRNFGEIGNGTPKDILTNAQLDGYTIFAVSPKTGTGWEATVDVVSGKVVVKFTTDNAVPVSEVKVTLKKGTDYFDLTVAFSKNAVVQPVSEGGGGCNALYPVLALLIFVPLAFRRK